MSNQDTNNHQTAFRPSLSLLDATMIVAGSMIGSGVFLVSAEITRSIGSAGWLTLMWVLGGIVTIIAAVSYGELSGMYPRAGGQYVYLREAYNPFIAFLFGWTQFGVIQAGTIAAVAVAFAKYSAFIIPFFSEDHILLDLGIFTVSAAQVLAIISIVVLTWINTRGIRNGKIIQTVFTLAKLISLFGLIGFGFFLGAKSEVWSANWAHAWDAVSMTKAADGSIVTTALSGLALFGAVAISMKGSLFSSDAWNNITFIAAEIKNPQRNIGRALFLGTFLVTIVYVSANLMYIAVLPLQEIAFVPKDRVAVAAATHIFGNGGAIVIAIMIMVSTFGCNNGLTLAGARIYYTMAQDKLFFKKAGELNKFNVPANGLWIQCLWASLLCLTGKYGDLLTMVIFGVLIFYVITILGIFILRRKQPDMPRPYKAFGYPVLPLLYIIVAASLALLLLKFEFNYAISGLGIILLGIPVYYVAMARSK